MISWEYFLRANTWMWDSSGILWSLCMDGVKFEPMIELQTWNDCRPTTGFTNHAVSHSLSAHIFLTNWSTSLPASLTIWSSSGVPFGERISLSNVTFQSASEGRHSGKVDDEGGGEEQPVKPHSPSWRKRAVIWEGTWEKSIMGRRVQIKVCSMSTGTGTCNVNY